MLQSAAAIGRKHSSSSAIHEALNPTRGIRDEITKRGGVPKNHAKDNARQLKVLQEKVRQKKERDQHNAAQKKRVPSSDRYSHVPSRLYLSSNSPLPPTPEGPSSTSSSPRNSAESTRRGPTPPSSRRPPPTTSSSSSRPQPSQQQQPPRSLARSASSSSLSGSGSPGTERKTKPGQVPAYLIQRKEEWARVEEEKRQRQHERDTWPEGTVPVPEEERLSTLHYLQQSQKELMLELSRFPITLQPSNVQKYRRQQEVLAKLRDVEKGIEVYSQDRVFMAKVD
ncbi:hypothetical protein H9P43_001977 [Blastocladiella emersonii ATCC 22665]|nr:hypothetical protein H9P43_001977 [Blastocladiella emersonii ATCC 22665]